MATPVSVDVTRQALHDLRLARDCFRDLAELALDESTAALDALKAAIEEHAA